MARAVPRSLVTAAVGCASLFSPPLGSAAVSPQCPVLRCTRTFTIVFLISFAGCRVEISPRIVRWTFHDRLFAVKCYSSILLWKDEYRSRVHGAAHRFRRLRNLRLLSLACNARRFRVGFPFFTHTHMLLYALVTVLLWYTPLVAGSRVIETSGIDADLWSASRGATINRTTDGSGVEVCGALNVINIFLIPGWIALRFNGASSQSLAASEQ